MAKIVIFGVGQWADLAQFYLENDSEHTVVAFTVDKEYLVSKQHNNLPVVNFDQVEKYFSPAEYKMFLPISFKRMNRIRAEKYKKAKEKGFQLISYISSKAIVWPGTTIGDNCLILEGNNLQPFVKIGDNVIMWSGNHIGHHTQIRNNVMIASHVVISGCCDIGENSFIGVNSTIRDETIVGRESLIGMSASIQRDTNPFEIYKFEPTKASRILSSRLKSISHKTEG